MDVAGPFIAVQQQARPRRKSCSLHRIASVNAGPCIAHVELGGRVVPNLLFSHFGELLRGLGFKDRDARQHRRGAVHPGRALRVACARQPGLGFFLLVESEVPLRQPLRRVDGLGNEELLAGLLGHRCEG